MIKIITNMESIKFSTNIGLLIVLRRMSKDMLTLFFSVFLTLFFIYPFQTIISNPIAGTASATPNPICSGANTTLTLTGYSGTIQWYSSANNTTFTIINGATHLRHIQQED